MKNPNEQNLLSNKCNAQDVVFDIKTIMQDYYFAQFIEEDNNLILLLDNGQKFVISVNEDQLV